MFLYSHYFLQTTLLIRVSILKYKFDHGTLMNLLSPLDEKQNSLTWFTRPTMIWPLPTPSSFTNLYSPTRFGEENRHACTRLSTFTYSAPPPRWVNLSPHPAPSPTVTHPANPYFSYCTKFKHHVSQGCQSWPMTLAPTCYHSTYAYQFFYSLSHSISTVNPAGPPTGVWNTKKKVVFLILSASLELKTVVGLPSLLNRYFKNG